MAAKMIKTKWPGIYKRGTRYVVVWYRRGRQHKESFRTEAEARAAQGRRNAGERTAYSTARFDDYAEDWLASFTGRASQGVAPSTLDLYTHDIKHRAIPFFRGLRLKDLDAADIRAYVKHLRSQGAKPPTIRIALTPLKVMLAMAAEDGHVAANVANGIRGQLGTTMPRKARAMTRAELSVVLAAAPQQYLPLFTFLAQTGLRIGEALGLDWEHVDLGTHPHVKVRQQYARGKDKRPELRQLKTAYSRRDVPLAPGMVQTLLALRASHYNPTAPVWAGARGGRQEANNLRSRALRPTVKPLGMEWVTFHTFRHTCASLLFEQGRNIKQVSAWLGHSDPAFTLRTYVHLMDEGVGDAAFLDAVVVPVTAG